jgi:flagellum-specific ATP synthase
MGGFTPGADPMLDQAVKSVPRIYEAMTQTLSSPPCQDPFIELAAALRNDAKPDEAADQPDR